MRPPSEVTQDVVRITPRPSLQLDAAGAGDLKALVMAGLRPGATVLLTLRSVRLIDSAGAGGLVAILKAVRDRGGALALIDVPAEIERALRLTKLSSVFEIHPDEKSALEALAVHAGRR
jgi:anti-anti-sigma factor